MIAPTRLLCLLVLVPLVPTVALFADGGLWPAVAAADALVAVLALVDLATLPRAQAVRVEREVQPIATRGVPHGVSLAVENRSRRALELLVVDDRPATVDLPEPLPTIVVPAGGRKRMTSRIVPRERGTLRLERVDVRIRSRLGLWHADHRLPCPATIRVYPALRQIGRYALYARANRMSLLGVRRSRRVGTDNEFERLRDYSSDDQFRSIDWRATARRRVLTVRDHQSDESQRVVFAVDCGRMMVNRTGGESLLDAALDAALTLAHVALSQRDEAGILCYDEGVTRWLPPRGGRGQLNRMIAAVHDVQPRLVESRADEALLHLERHCRKRTLLVVLTHVIDDRNAERIRLHLAPAKGRHLALVALLRDRALLDAVEGWTRRPPGLAAPGDLERAGAAADILLWRRQVLDNLEREGVLTLDAAPHELTADLVSKYLAIKARRLL